MKRFFSLMLALALLLSVSLSAAESVTFETKYFTLPLPDGWTTDYSDLTTIENGEDLGYFYAPEMPGLLVESCMIYYEDLKNYALWNSDADELQDYIDATLEDFEAENAEYLTTVMAGSVPFVVIRGTDEDGEFLYADTLTNGYAIEFWGYMSDDTDQAWPLTDKAIEQFVTVLEGFKPVSGT